MIEYAGDELSVPIASQSPPATLRSNATSCVARSGSANSRSSTLPRWFEPSARRVPGQRGRRRRRAVRGALRRVWPALSSTVARYWTVVPARRPGHVVEHAVGRVVVGADRLPAAAAAAGLERDLVERVAADVRAHLHAPVRRGGGLRLPPARSTARAASAGSGRPARRRPPRAAARSRPGAAARRCAASPGRRRRRGRTAPRGAHVGIAAVCGVSALLSATTYSRWRARSIRENA